MIIIKEWKSRESSISLNELDEETQELIKKLVTTDEVENYNTKTNDIIQKYAEYYKNKGYSDDDIKVIKEYFVAIDEYKVVYDIKLKVMTQHSELFDFITSYKEIKLTSYEYDKERNELGEKIKSKVQLIKLRKQNEELEQKIKELQEKLKKYKGDEDEDEDDE